eukprot:Hpha_TRINITY_DN2694_c0_g1::TRINITY_DN2694_c0_g1_i1::g.145847::m.145847
MPCFEKCTSCGFRSLLDYDPTEWTQAGHCDKCGHVTNWELEADDPAGNAVKVKALDANRMAEEQAKDHHGSQGPSTPGAVKREPADGVPHSPPDPPPTPPPSDAAKSQSAPATMSPPRMRPEEGGIPDWLKQSDWTGVVRFREEGTTPRYAARYARDRASVSLDDLRVAFQNIGSERKSVMYDFNYSASLEEQKAADQEYRNWAGYLEGIDGATWRVDREAVEAALPPQVRKRCTLRDVLCIAAVRRAVIISESLVPLDPRTQGLLAQAYKEGASILPLSRMWRRPPTQLMSAVLQYRRDRIPRDAFLFQLWRNPEQYLAEPRDQQEVLSCKRNDTVLTPEYRWEVRERRVFAEEVFVAWLESLGVRFWVRQQLENCVGQNREVPLLLLYDRLYLNKGMVQWVEFYDVYGFESDAAGRGRQLEEVMDMRVAALEAQWGAGVVLYQYGHSPGCGSRWQKSCALDPSEISPEMKRLLVLVQTLPLAQLRTSLQRELHLAFGTPREVAENATELCSTIFDTSDALSMAPSKRASSPGGESEASKRPRKTGRGSRAAMAAQAKKYRQVWDGAERASEELRIHGNAPDFR